LLLEWVSLVALASVFILLQQIVIASRNKREHLWVRVICGVSSIWF